MPKAFTIGHSTHEPEAFAELLREHGVQLLVDVRRHPAHVACRGRIRDRSSGYCRSTTCTCPAWEAGDAQRTTRKNGFWDNEGFHGYADHMASEEFAAALQELIELARERRVAVMCAEGPWWRCHRRLLADTLLVQGLEVDHIDPRGDTEPTSNPVDELTRAEGARHP